MGNFHSYVNIGSEELEIYEAFNVAHNLSEVSLLSGAQHFGASTLSCATGLKKDVLEKVLKKSSQDYIIPF